MKIETELNVGDTMYVIEEDTSFAEIKAVVKKCKIKAVLAFANDFSKICVRYVGDYGRDYALNYKEQYQMAAFKTFEEAQAYADELNKEGLKKYHLEEDE